jgi:5-methyltetrahydropteroyltriglutamate--homocysteine methyltransferase
MDLLQRDIANFKAALNGVKVEEAFMPAISTTNLEDWLINRHYSEADEYRAAIADAMHQEYKAIVDAGFLLQVDDPRLSSYYVMHPDKSMKEVRSWARSRVETLNYALRGIPEDRIRYHTCYSINMGPRVHDMQLKDIVDIISTIRCGAFSFEAANPRHEHEWQLFNEIKWPKDKMLIPGVISHTTVLVEHPELVAQRLVRFADAVGRENVMAGSDCGFGTFASTTPEVHPSIVWVKLQALVDGARIASKQLWKGARRPAPKKARAAVKRKPVRTRRRRAA